SMTFPVAQGDECLVVFASRCIDSWWQSGGIQEQAELRMHDLSDGFAILGFRSQPRALSNISTTSAQLRSDDGATFIDL
ncbi:Gp138 family membrane-puncturing spike protein, partial [Salmonella enterica]|uniref:Gp138 family membrane-puncturing spike protein n=1 Tax=Salmonella enterica TaxID=28901 RepID=UPI003CF588E7